MSKRVLLIEDDRQMGDLISNYLKGFGYFVTVFEDPLEALNELSNSDYDIVILDLMLPNMDGFDVCKKIKSSSDVPVIISSARGDIGNKIHGFELGADDYLAKPYEPRELVLRIEAVLKRAKKGENIKISDFEIDKEATTIYMEGYPLELTPIEYKLFSFLLQNQNRAVSREQLVNAASLPIDTKSRTIDMHISNIRQKIGDNPKKPTYIKSVWGVGYKFIG